MDTNRSGVAWRRFLVEGVVIVASILLAFGIDAWWDGKQEEAEVHELLQTLAAEFINARAALELGMAADSSSLDRAEALRRASRDRTSLTTDSIQSLAAALVVGANRPVSLPRYDAAVVAGRIGVLQGDSLIIALADFDIARRNHQALFDILRDRFYGGSTDQLRRELGTLSIFNPRGGRGDPPPRFVPDDLNTLIQEPRVYAEIEVMLVTRFNLLRWQEAMDAAAERALAAIEAELR